MRLFSFALGFLVSISLLVMSGFVLQIQACAKDQTAKHKHKAERKPKMDSKNEPASKPDPNSKSFLFRQTGGFIGVNRQYEKQLTQLSTDEREKLEKLISQSGLLDVKEDKHLTKGAADVFYYEFSFNDGKSVHHIVFDDVSLPDSYRPLVQFLKDKVTDLRR